MMGTKMQDRYCSVHLVLNLQIAQDTSCLVQMQYIILMQPQNNQNVKYNSNSVHVLFVHLYAILLVTNCKGSHICHYHLTCKGINIMLPVF